MDKEANFAGSGLSDFDVLDAENACVAKLMDADGTGHGAGPHIVW